MASLIDMIELLDILYKGHQFTPELLTRKIPPDIYRKTVRMILDNMLLKELSFKQNNNESVHGELYGSNIKIIAKYDIGANYQVIVIFNDISNLMGIDIGYELTGLNVYEKKLYNRDAALHALFLYTLYTFKKIYKLPTYDICAVPKCIYFKNCINSTPFCRNACLMDKINIKCIKLREQGRVCNCKICGILRKL